MCEAKVYVGTYAKYNSGSIAGAWISLAECENYGQFLSKCKDVHKDERDPEFMIQDTEDFPDGLSCMEWISEQDFNDVKAAMEEETERASLRIVDYSEKAIAVVGDTKAVKDQLKAMGGRFNGRLSCGAGWIFSVKQRGAVEAFIMTGATIQADAKATEQGAKFVEWFKEYAQGKETDDYNVKNHVGAIKMHGHYYLIEKPSIKNRFCFHDEGPQYDFYCSLSDDEKMAAYFKAENLDHFDRQIKAIEDGDRVVWYKGDNSKQMYFYIGRTINYGWIDGQPEKYHDCTDEEKALILEGLKFGRKMFEKRLDAYLKRYGTSKIHTWTYWADA